MIQAAVGNASKEDGKVVAKMADELAHAKAKAKQDAEGFAKSMDQLQAKLDDFQAAAAVKEKAGASEGMCCDLYSMVEFRLVCRSITW